LQQLQCLHYGATFVLLYASILFVTTLQVTNHRKRAMALVQDIMLKLISKALLTLFFALNVINKLKRAEIKAFMYQGMGHTIHK